MRSASRSSLFVCSNLIVVRPVGVNPTKSNTVQLRIFGTNFRPVETRNFASLPRFLGLTELYCHQIQF
ncbi:hypothetical protein GXM_03373 [Nostoc sphaeroides CCNUC1]|uniref:Uncharacterized protein n=1 Tax=Nostoc sphaeroides CCNUC1 TaxID=2653204 RepID=A0A5P8VZX2_9NOSO|nr:hypothetical protein GXM_03373 [Nostoc sphaeroides CCNUC1]